MSDRKPITISGLHNYPVTIDSAEFKQYSNRDLFNELNAIDSTATEKDVTKWLDAAHKNLYNLIYHVGGKSYKDQIINRNIDIFESELKDCIITQLDYMLEAGGDYGTVDGSHTTADGKLELIATKFIKDKIIAPRVYATLRAAKPNLILGVRDDLYKGANEGV